MPTGRRARTRGAGPYTGYGRNFRPAKSSAGSLGDRAAIAALELLAGKPGPTRRKRRGLQIEEANGLSAVAAGAAKALAKAGTKAGAKAVSEGAKRAGKTFVAAAKPVKGGPTPKQQAREAAMAERRKLAGVTNKKNGKNVPSGAASRTGDKFLKPVAQAERDLQKKNAGSLKGEVDKARSMGGTTTERLMQPNVGKVSKRNAKAVTGRSRDGLSDAELAAQRSIDEKKLANARDARKASDDAIRAQGDKPGGKPPIYPQPKRNYGRTVTKSKTFKNPQGEKFKADVEVEAAKLKPQRSKYKTQAGFDRAMKKWTDANQKWLAENKVSPAAADRAVATSKPAAASKGGSGKPAPKATPAKPAEKPAPSGGRVKLGKFPKKPTKAQREQAARDMEAYRGQNKADAPKPSAKRPGKDEYTIFVEERRAGGQSMKSIEREWAERQARRAEAAEPGKRKPSKPKKPSVKKPAATKPKGQSPKAKAEDAAASRNAVAAAARADRSTKANAARNARDAAAAEARTARNTAAAAARADRNTKANAARAARDTTAAGARDARNTAAAAARADRSTKANAAAASRNAEAAAARAKSRRRFPKKAAAVAGAGAAGVTALGLIPGSKKTTGADSKPTTTGAKKDWVLDNAGRRISRAEFNRRQAWRKENGLEIKKGESRPEYRKRLEAWKKANKKKTAAETKRRNAYRSAEGKTKFGDLATRKTREQARRRANERRAS